MTRGRVVPLSLAEIATRARYLGQLAHSAEIDPYVRDPEWACIDGYYLLAEHNGGRDPTAPDPFDRWSKPGQTFINRTADCIGGAAWCGGWDRYQPIRFAHIYEGSINTNSMLIDALGPRRCFEVCDRPMPGCFIVAPSGAIGFGVGHIATVYAVPAEWDANEIDCWRRVLAVDVAARTPNPANRPTTAAPWFRARKTATNTRLFSAFVRSTMTA